jgi:outer membrane protein TolC
MLCNVIGEDFETQVLPADTEINIESPGSLDDNVNDCPEVQLMQMGIKAREKQVKLAKGELLPTLALVGGWNYMGNLKMEGVAEYQGMMIPYTQSFDQSFWYGALSLSVPIWNWGKSCNSVKKAKLEVENAELDLQRNTRLLTIQAKQAVQNVMSGYSLIETAQLGYEQATENLRIMREKYDGNYCTLTDLLDVQSQWQQAECNLIEAKTQYKISESEYLKAIGKLGEKK